MIQSKKNFSGLINSFFVSLAYIFLYLPIFILILFSFNSSSVSIKWTGFTLHWYHNLFTNPEIWQALKVSLIVAFSSTFITLTLATLLVLSEWWWNGFFLTNLFYMNIILPDIILAAGILSIFTFLKIPLGYFSLIVGHSVLGLGFAIPIIKSRFNEIDPMLTEASLDLGATYFQTFTKIILPLLRPGLIAAGLLIFTLSLDDFLIAFFCSSSNVQTLSVYVYSLIKTWVDPTINAVSTCLLLFSSILVLIICLFNLVEMVVSNDE